MVCVPPLLSPALQHAWQEAQQALQAARQRCGQQGLDPDDTRANLERQLSALALADVHADVEAHLREVVRAAGLDAAAAALPQPR